MQRFWGRPKSRWAQTAAWKQMKGYEGGDDVVNSVEGCARSMWTWVTVWRLRWNDVCNSKVERNKEDGATESRLMQRTNQQSRDYAVRVMVRRRATIDGERLAALIKVEVVNAQLGLCRCGSMKLTDRISRGAPKNGSTVYVMTK